MCYAINRPDSFANVKKKWIKELREHGPEVPVILVGTKLDLREEKGKAAISVSEGKSVAKEIGAVEYMECSALTQKNLRNVFERAVRAVISPNMGKEEGGCAKCVVS